MINKTVINKIKKKIKPLMPDSAYIYFIKWLEVIAIEPELPQTTADKRTVEIIRQWHEAGMICPENFEDFANELSLVSEPKTLSELFEYEQSEPVEDEWSGNNCKHFDPLKEGNITHCRIGHAFCEGLEGCNDHLVSEPKSSEYKLGEAVAEEMLALVSEPVERKPTIITRPPKQGGESGEWKDGKFIPLVSEPVEDEIEITTRVYNRWSTEKYVDHFGIYEPFPLWLSNRRKDA